VVNAEVTSRVAHNAIGMNGIITVLRAIGPDLYPLQVSWGKPRKHRSLDQNAISHAWYATVAAVEKEYTPAEVKRFCKYHFGVPILRENLEYSHMIEKVLAPLNYEERVKAMEFINVTSLMTKAQLSTYLEHVQDHYRGRVPLEFPA
jgi:hypothetical protein